MIKVANLFCLSLIIANTACTTTTWTSKKDEVATQIKATMPEEIPLQVRDSLSMCIATAATKLADEYGCPFPDKEANLTHPLEKCLKEKGNQVVIRDEFVKCIQAAREELMKTVVPQPT